MMRANGTTGHGPAGRLLFAALLVLVALGGTVHAQTATPASPPATATPAPAPSPAPVLAPATPASPPAAVAPANPPSATAPTVPAEPGGGSTSTEDRQPTDSSISGTLELPTHPAITLSAQANWDDGFKSITDSFAKLDDALAKVKIAGVGHPLAVFTETNDTGFKYTAMIPIDKVPDGKPDLGPGIGFGETPGGKAMRFQHRSAYDDIDSTYQAITAYLDEKGIEAKNLFAEEYLHPTKTSDDTSLEVDIYVYLK